MIALSGSTFDTTKFASRIVAQQHTDWNMEAAAVRPMGVEPCNAE